MRLRLEWVIGGAMFGTILASALTLGVVSGSATLRAFSLLVGLGAGAACGVLAGLAAHLAREPAHYEPVTGAAGAWGFAELEEQN